MIDAGAKTLHVEALKDAVLFAKLSCAADTLKEQGDAAGGNRTAERRKLLRECRRLRIEAKRYGRIVN